MADDEDFESKHGAWTPEEDGLLAYFQKTYGNRWSLVAQHIPGRTGQQCAQRWRHKVNPHIRKEKWTQDEDRSLAALVAQHGNKWADIAKHIPGRTDQQCMGRWRRHLDPNIRKCSWLAKEDEVLKVKYNAIGSQWSNISKFLEGRTAQQCRARWFQIEPSEAEASARQPSSSASNKRERHHDGASIKASARHLLAQMDEGHKGKGCKPRISNGRTDAASQDYSDEEFSSEDEAVDISKESDASPNSRIHPLPTSRRSAMRRTTSMPAPPPPSQHPVKRGARGSNGNKARFMSPSDPPDCDQPSERPGCSDIMAMDPCDFKWACKSRRSILMEQARDSPIVRTQTTPPPRESPNKRKIREAFATPNMLQQNVSDEPEAEDLEAADILTELSGSFHFLSRKSSPGSVRQPRGDTEGERHPSTPIKPEYNWDVRQPAFLETPEKGGVSPSNCMETPKTLQNDNPPYEGILSHEGLPHDISANYNSLLLMTPSSQKLLSGLSYEPIDKSVCDLSVGFSNYSDSIITPTTIAHSETKHRQSHLVSPDSSTCKPAARRLQFSAKFASRGPSNDGCLSADYAIMDSVRCALMTPSTIRHDTSSIVKSGSGAMLPPPPLIINATCFDTPSHKRRLIHHGDHDDLPGLSSPLFVYATETPYSNSAILSKGSSVRDVEATVTETPQSDPRRVKGTFEGGQAHMQAVVTSTPLLIAPLMHTDIYKESSMSTIRVEAVRQTSGDSNGDSPMTTSGAAPANKENQFGNPCERATVHDTSMVRVSDGGADSHDEQATQPTVPASSYQIKSQLENLIEDVFADF